jgi:alpha-L-fucosidase 2
MKIFELNFPIERPHSGLVMGNGNFGVMLWGHEKLCISVNRSDFWDHRGGEVILAEMFYKKAVEAAANPASESAFMDIHDALHEPQKHYPGKPQRLPLGRFELSFSDNAVPRKLHLDYNSGTVTLELSNNEKILLDLSIGKHCLFIEDPSKSIADVNSVTSWEYPQVREHLSKLNFTKPELVNEDDSTGWIMNCPSDDPSLASVCRFSTGECVVMLEYGNDANEALKNVQSGLSKLDKNALLATSRAWWKNYWDDIPEINIPDKFFQKFYYYAIYKFGAATNPHGYACGLQGPWHEEYQPATWSGDYHFNVNIQQIYTLPFVLGKADHLMPLFDMIESESFQKCLKTNAKSMFGITDGLWLTMAVDDLGFQVGGLGAGSILDPACGAWVAQLYWFYYQYTEDEIFLRERALPFITGIMRCYEEMFEEYEGRLSIPIAVSAEYNSADKYTPRAGRDPSSQLSAVHMLLGFLSKSCEILGESPKSDWNEISERLPHYNTVDGFDSRYKPERHLAIWEGQDLDICHRHHSHLSMIYPFDTITDKPDSETRKIIANSINHWLATGMGDWAEWCMPWAAIIQARMGFNNAPFTLLNLWKDLFINEGLATVYIPKYSGMNIHRLNDIDKPKGEYEIMQLDGTMGGATAILECLAMVKGETIHLFQGIPDHWQDVEFRNIHLPGGFAISGKLGGVVIVSAEKGGSISICINNKYTKLHLKAGEEKHISL